MALSKALLTLLLLTTVTGLPESSHGSGDSPVITSTNLQEIVVNPGENYTITCEARSPVTWNYPDILDDEPRIHVTQKNGKYISSIQLIDITVMNVGYYHCLIDDERNSSIYLYVNDTEILLTSGKPFGSIHGIQYQEIIIPCKPTHPEVKVTLCRNGEEKLNVGDNEILGVFRYNNKVGFILENATVIHSGTYVCCAFPGDICSPDCPLTYSVEVLKYPIGVHKPLIDDTHLQHVKVGDNLTIGCRVNVPISTRYKLEWIIPYKNDRTTVESHVLVEVPSMAGDHLATARRNLKILNVKLEDRGNYTCKVKDHVGNSNSDTIYLNVFNE